MYISGLGLKNMTAVYTGINCLKLKKVISIILVWKHTNFVFSINQNHYNLYNCKSTKF